MHVFFFGSSLGLVADAVALSEAGCVLDSLELVFSAFELLACVVGVDARRPVQGGRPLPAVRSGGQRHEK